jgi:hypothetical protein
MQRQYRLLFALLGLAMLLTAQPVAHLARRAYERAHGRVTTHTSP